MRMFQKETGLSYRAWLQQMHIALALSKLRMVNLLLNFRVTGVYKPQRVQCDV